ncbi:response regulator transcription factor [Pseudonocardia aurantiaca]|uniref:Response regulator n=1 Tax=Pseudonocardia aurantiaca TaxID=75290 RepID=A0ABW4FE13_9PSEU
MTEQVRVVVVDDQLVVREGLMALLGLAREIDVAGDAGDGAQAVELLATTACDVVLMDLRMPVLDGAAATRVITQEHPAVAVLVLTTYDDDRSLADALAAGARGFLTKDAGRAEIVAAIRAAATGQSAFGPGVARRLAEALVGTTTTTAVAEPPAGLTAREAEVLMLIARGASNADIAESLVIAPATVKTHINNLFAKIGVQTRADAVRYAYGTGLARP